MGTMPNSELTEQQIEKVFNKLSCILSAITRFFSKFDFSGFTVDGFSLPT